MEGKVDMTEFQYSANRILGRTGDRPSIATHYERSANWHHI